MANMATERASDALQPIYIASITMIVLSTFFFILRYVARLWVKRIALGLDDLALLGAYIADLIICATGLAMYFFELRGNPPADVPLTTSLDQINSQLKPVLICQYIMAQLNFVGLMLPKLSLLFLYLRLFSLNRPFRWATYSIIAFVLLSATVYSFVSFFSCTPVDYYWDKTREGGKCLKFDPFYRGAQGINTLQDILVLGLPLYPLWRLQAPLARKLGLSMVFGVGCIGLAVGLVKWINFLLYPTTIVAPYYTAKLVTWVVVESPTYLIACCLAGCGPLYTACIKAAKTYTHAYTASYDQTGHTTNDSFSRLHENKSAANSESTQTSSDSGQAKAGSMELNDISDPNQSIVVKTDVYVTRS